MKKKCWQALLAREVGFRITDHVIFSRDLFFYPSKNIHFYTRSYLNQKAKILKSIITRSEMGQRTTQVSVLIVNLKPADTQSYSTYFVCFRSLQVFCSNGISSSKQFSQEERFETIRTEAKV